MVKIPVIGDIRIHTYNNRDKNHVKKARSGTIRGNRFLYKKRWRFFMRVVLIAFLLPILVYSAQEDERRVWQGTWFDSLGSRGPVRCEARSTDGTNWNARFEITWNGRRKSYRIKMISSEEGIMTTYQGTTIIDSEFYEFTGYEINQKLSITYRSDIHEGTITLKRIK
jgi:hypothetical protein